MRSNLISISISIHALREEGDSLSEAITKLKADFYPRPPRGGRLIKAIDAYLAKAISIHALREEGDLRECSSRERRCRFLSTPSARRATSSTTMRSFWLKLFLSTPSARRATAEHDKPLATKGISIHALREEGDFRQ